MNKDIFDELYEHLKPVVKSHAQRLSRVLGISVDDATQEALVTLYTYMDGYDYNKGTLKAYAHTLLRNAFVSYIKYNRAQKRVPHAHHVDESGQLQVVKFSRLMPLSDVNEPTQVICELDMVLGRQRKSHARFARKLLRVLSPRERLVFQCLYVPSEQYAQYLNQFQLEPSQVAAARYLNLSKNALDWSALKIRLKITRLAEQELPATIKSAIKVKEWPVIHISRKHSADYNFIARTIKQRHLDPKPSAQKLVKVSYQRRFASELTTYEWGVTLVIKNDKDEIRTLVIEGKFNPTSGLITGPSGTVKQLAQIISWYPQLVRELR